MITMLIVGTLVVGAFISALIFDEMRREKDRKAYLKMLQKAYDEKDKAFLEQHLCELEIEEKRLMSECHCRHTCPACGKVMSRSS